jgi:LmbE family N-acetylglucosaminyl deacetylase
MATVVFLHAHPDDECLTTGGTMAQLAAEGHRVVLVTATDGALGEVPDGLLAEDESLASRRAREVKASAKVLGVASVHLLDYHDSGMVGTDGNAAPDAFCNVDVDEAARRLAKLLEEEGADVLVTYDDHGNYGHPDHIQVHHVGVRAADLAGTPSLYQVTVNRDEMLRFMEQAIELGLMSPSDDGVPTSEEMAMMGLPASEITTTVDVDGFVTDKLAAMRCHETQVGDMDFFLKMPEEAFRRAFAREHYVRMRAPDGVPADRLV